MKNKYLPFFILFCMLCSFANTSRYRLMLGENPSTSIIIGWDQISGSDPVVYYGENDHGQNYSSYLYSKKYDSQIYFRDMQNTFVTLDNLKPNTTYYFVIKDSEGVSNRYSFQTIPDDVNAQLSIVAGGDSRNSTSVRIKGNTLVSKLNPHVVIFDGDMTGGDSGSEWREWFDHWQYTINSDGKMTPIIPARGNHEQPETISKLFNISNKKEYYSLSLSKLLTVYTLNSEIAIAGDQTDWLKEELIRKRNQTVHQMAQYHRPMRPHNEGKSDRNEQYFNWAHLFYDYDVRLVLEGDSHTSKVTYPIRPTYEEGNDEGFIIENQKGTTYVGEGCWGAPLRSARDYKTWTKNAGEFNQFKLLWINKEKIEARTIKIDESDLSYALSDNQRYTLPLSVDVFEGMDNPTIIRSNSSTQDSPSTQPSSAKYEKIISRNMTSSYQDVEETIRNGGLDTGSGNLDFVNEKLVGLVFNDIALSSEITVTEAYIQFTAYGSNNDPATINIEGLTNIDLTRFTNYYAVSKETTTSNKVVWNPEEWTDEYYNYRTSDLSSIINELIQVDSWASGKSLAFKMTTEEGSRYARSYNGRTSPVLFIKYIENAPSKSGQKQHTLQISRDEDDAFEYIYNGDMNYWDAYLYMPEAGSTDTYTGLVFSKSGIEKGAKIKSAYLQFYTTSTNNYDASINIQGIKELNTASFTRDRYNISSRPFTQEKIEWTPTLWRDRNHYQSVDISSIVQEIIDQDGWQEINNIGFVLSGTGNRYAHSFDNSSGFAPKLVIEYDLPNTTVDSENMIISRTKITEYNNDIEENAYGNIDFGSRELDLSFRGNENEPQITGLIFNTSIPKYARIVEAYIQFTAEDIARDSTYLQVRGIKEPGNLDRFYGRYQELRTKTLTDTYQDWTPEEWLEENEASEKQRTPDLTNVLQEVIDDPYWKTGYGIGFSIFGTGKRPAYSRNHSLEYAPELVVKYVMDEDYSIPETPVSSSGSYTITRTIEIPIIQTYDDAEEYYNGGIDLHSYDLDIAKDYRENHLVGLIFKNLPIPRNATIQESHIQFTTDHDEITQEDSFFQIKAITDPEKYMNPFRFYGIYKEISNMPLTQSSTLWNPDPWLIRNETGDSQKTPDLSTIITEAISNDYWLENSSLGFVISGTGKRDAKSFENVYLENNRTLYENGDYKRTPAVLSITYSYMSDTPPTTTSSRKNTVTKEVKTQDDFAASVSIYPNPTSDYLYVQSTSNERIKEVAVFNVLGVKVMQTNPVNTSKASLNLAKLQEGVYYVRIINEDNESIKKKIFKKN